MRLRRRMLLSSSAQLLVLGLLLALAYGGYQRRIAPTLREYLQVKTSDAAHLLQAELDIPLAAEDPAMVESVVARLLGDPDLAYIDVRNAAGAVVFHHGQPGTSLVARAAVSLEGVALGTVEVGYSTARMDRFDTWAHRLAAVAALIWLAAFFYSIQFSRLFVAPIRRMMKFSGEIADGRFTARLEGGATDELGELAEHLGRMARELDSREQERLRSAARAEEMRQELLTVSRMAGMAEVATGVLHNVGNVLNSLTTSVSLMTTQVRSSKVGALGKSLALYREHPGGLAGFLSTDKGQLLPRYLDKVAGQLAADNTGLERELESMSRNVEHIAAIVATQQAYTRVAAIRDATDLTTVVDDALHMVEGSCARHQIEMVKDFRSTAVLVTDRHKVLQIVVNLISNARHAVRDVARPRIAVTIAPAGSGIAVTVEDNGVGIPAELLDKIFRHGFTTKPDGHGFGLHSAANAAAELGGQLAVASAGAGAGARFTLTLPTQVDQVPDALAS